MTARDRCGYCNIYEDGRTESCNKGAKNPFIQVHYSELDGWSYISRGADCQYHIELTEKVTDADLLRLREMNSIRKHRNLVEILDKVLKEKVRVTSMSVEE